MHNYKAYTDEQLISLFIKGDKQAFAVLYQKYKECMYNYFLFKLLANKEQAMDSTQQLFLQMIDKCESYNAQYTFKQWMYGIANNLCKNIYRENAKNKNLKCIDLSIENIIDEMDAEYVKKMFHKKLSEMQPIHKEVLLLRYQSDLTIKEIAEIIQEPEGTVKSRIFYAIKHLSKELQAYKIKSVKNINLWKQ